MNDRELVTDAYPRNRPGGAPGNDPQQTGAVEHEVELFAKRVADELPKDLAWLNAREIERYFAKGSARAP